DRTSHRARNVATSRKQDRLRLGPGGRVERLRERRLVAACGVEPVGQRIRAVAERIGLNAAQLEADMSTPELRPTALRSLLLLNCTSALIAPCRFRKSRLGA